MGMISGLGHVGVLRRIGLFCLSLAWMVAGAGCSGEPARRVLPSPLPSAWIGPPPPSPSAPDLTGWWRAFHDPQLDALVARALRDNLDIAAAGERLRAARRLQRSATHAYLPTIRAKTDEALDPDSSASFFVAGLDATWEWGLFGRAQANRQLAQASARATQADVLGARVSVIGEVTRTWIELRAAQQRDRLLREAQAALTEQVRLTDARVALGLESAQASSAAKTSLLRTAVAGMDARGSADAAARRLALLLGLNAPEGDWAIAGAVPSLGAWTLDAAPADLLRTRPAVIKAESDLLRQAGELGVARANRYPSVALGASMVWSTQLLSHRRTQTRGIASAGPLIDIPLFDWGIRQAVADAQRHTYDAAVYGYRQAVLEGVADVQSALDRVNQGAERERLAQAAWEVARAGERASAIRQGLQLASGLERSSHQVATTQAALEAVDAKVAHDVAYVALFKAVGGAPLPATSWPGGGGP